MKKQWLRALVLVSFGSLAMGACDDQTPSDSGSNSSSSSASAAASSSSGEGGAGGAGGSGGGMSCVSNPTTHVEIINACTDAEKIDKVVTLPLLEPDGSLPPLP